MMGSTEDPEDGTKVATAVFGAVVVYAVRLGFSSDGDGEESTGNGVQQEKTEKAWVARWSRETGKQNKVVEGTSG